jgi:hypothetical protein
MPPEFADTTNDERDSEGVPVLGVAPAAPNGGDVMDAGSPPVAGDGGGVGSPGALSYGSGALAAATFRLDDVSNPGIVILGTDTRVVERGIVTVSTSWAGSESRSGGRSSGAAAT